jgi:hypothetical protein
MTRSAARGMTKGHGGARGSGPPGERNGQFRRGERTKAAINMQIVINPDKLLALADEVIE